MERRKRVELVASRGATSVFIEAGIDELGNLVLSGQDIGQAPQEWFGESDYEYWLVVNAADKARVLSALPERTADGQTPGPAPAVDPDWALLRAIADRYRGDVAAVSAFRDLLAASGIPFEFRTF